MDVCTPSGLLPTDACPLVAREVFLEGNQPVNLDDLYREFAINRETNLLATIFTPPALVDEKVFMVGSGSRSRVGCLEGHPDSARYLRHHPGRSRPQPGVDIASPEMFDEVSGRISVTGTAAGEDFLFYRLQYGQGLNPQSWVQIGDNSTVSGHGRPARRMGHLRAEWAVCASVAGGAHRPVTRDRYGGGDGQAMNR